MSGSAHQQNKPIYSQYTLHGEILAYVDCARYPGVGILKDLTWNTHIKEILTKANRTLGFVKRKVRTKKKSIKELAYKTFVRSKLECMPPHTDKTQKQLQWFKGGLHGGSQINISRWTVLL